MNDAARQTTTDVGDAAAGDQTKTIGLDSFLLGQQKKLLTALEVSRELIEHAGAKGDASELDWTEVVGHFLPSRYCVAKGFVIDSNEQRSDQFDVIVYDEHFCPLFFEAAGYRYIPAESVYAVFEVKQDISKEHIEYAADKLRSARRLHRTSVEIVHAGGTHEPRPLFPIIGGLLALEASWKPTAFGAAFSSAIARTSDLVDGVSGQLDLGCAIRHGAFAATYAEGDVTLELSDPEAGLIFFLLRLFQRLQSLGSVPAIDLGAYSRVIEAPKVPAT